MKIVSLIMVLASLLPGNDAYATQLLLDYNYIQHHLAALEKSYVKKVLDNGLTILVLPLPNSYKVYVGITYNVGSKDESVPQEYGFAHAIEHMIFKGTTTLSETDIQAIAEKFGVGSIGQGFNAFTSQDMTHYYFLSDKENWPIFLKVLTDCMTNARIEEQHFLSEVKAILQEMAMRKANPSAIIFDHKDPLLYPTLHPYHHATIGYKQQLLDATSEQLKHFYKKFYVPNNATIIIAGGVEPTSTIELVTKTCSKIPPAASLPARLPNGTQEHLIQKKATIYTHTPTPLLCYFWEVPKSSHNSYNNFECIEYLLQEELTKQLIDRTHQAHSVQVHLHTRKLDSVFSVMVSPLDKTEEALERITHQLIATLNNATTFLTTKAITQFKNDYTSSFFKSFENSRSAGSCINHLYYYHPDHTFSSHLAAINNLETITVQHACQEFLTPNKMYTIACLPIPEAATSSWLALQEQLEHENEALLQQKQERTIPVEEPRFVFQTPTPKLIDLTFHKPDEHFTLANGLAVYIKKNPQTPFISIILQFKNQDQLKLANGLANKRYVQEFAMNMLEEIDGLESKYAFQEFCNTNGISFSFSKNALTFSCPRHLLTQTLHSLSQLLQQATYPTASFKQHQASYLDYLKQLEQKGSYKAHTILTDYLFTQYPWHQTQAEAFAEVSTIKREHLLAFKKYYIIPQTMQLIIVGNIEQEEAKEAVQTELNAWTHKDTVHLPKITIPFIDNPEHTVIKQHLPQQEISLAAGRLTDYKDTQAMLALDLLENYLNKKLFEIREKTGLFYSSHASFHHNSFLTKGYISLQTTVAPHNIERTKQEIINALSALAYNGITQEELTTAKHTALLHLATSFGSNRALAASYAYLLANNLNWDYFDNLAKRIKAIPLQQVNSVARNYLDPKTWTFVHVGRITNHDS